MNDPGLLLSSENGYENISGRCEWCQTWVIANRATDLDNASFASGRTLPCPSCGARLRVGGDTGNHPIDLILFDTYALRHERRYMFGILALAQALEVALAECARYVFVQQPLVKDRADLAISAPDLLDAFEAKVRNMTLHPFRNLLIRCAVDRLFPQNRGEASEMISSLNHLARVTASDAEIAGIDHAFARETIRRLKESTIGTLRNDVAHHLGRRPTQSEFEQQFNDVEALIRALLKVFGLTPQGGQLVVRPV